jgi:protein O-GlcNAc transferase
MPTLWAFFIYNPGIMVKKNRSKSRVIDAEKAVEFYNQAVIFHQNNQLSESESAYRVALKLNPAFAEAHNNLGNVLKDQGRLKEALSEYRKAHKIYSDHPILLNNIGNTLLSLGDIKQAIQYLNKAIELADDYVDPLNNLANAYRSSGKFEEAAKTYIKAIEIDPNIADIHYNLASLLAYLNKTEESVIYYKNTLRLEPDNVAAASTLHHQLRNLCDWSELDELQENIQRNLASAGNRNVRDLGSPFLAVTRTDDLAENYLIAKVACRKIINSLERPKAKEFGFGKRKKQQERIKIGYLSNDFYDHATMHLLMGVFREHDNNQVEFICYSYGKDDSSEYRKKLMEYSDAFVDVSNYSDYEAAKKIYNDGIDILVDLKGHTQDSHLGICACRPAPVQVTYLGFPGTSGANFFDYVLTDYIVTPQSHDKYYSEKFAYLPDTYQPNDNQQKISDKIITRSEVGLPQDGFVFSSFNQPYKLDPVFFDIWMRLLSRVDNSVLWLYVNNATVIKNLQFETQKRGIDPQRLIFAEKLPKELHLARIGLADLVLDTRIYNGHTTTADSLWAGVPVITMQGRHFASRVSSSLLHAIRLSELVTTDLAGYEALALRLASNPGELEKIREKLHQNRNTAPLFDTVRFTRNLEQAYRMMWQRYLEGKKPEHIEVNSPE